MEGDDPMASLSRVRERLEAVAHNEGAVVHYRTTASGNENGYFVRPRKQGLRAQIVVRREHQQIQS